MSLIILYLSGASFSSNECHFLGDNCHFLPTETISIPRQSRNVIKLRKSKIVTGNKEPVTIFMNIM